MKYTLTSSNKEKGFTLLFSILVATLVVAIGASIASIAMRQTILSGTSRESQYAFYSANTVLECAFYWDITNSNVFPVPGDDSEELADPEAITCAGGSILTGTGFDNPDGWSENPRVWEVVDEGSDVRRATFYMEIKDQGTQGPGDAVTRCAQATVIKTVESDDSVTTRIEAKGYNTCDESNPRRVERGLVQEYQS